MCLTTQSLSAKSFRRLLILILLFSYWLPPIQVSIQAQQAASLAPGIVDQEQPTRAPQNPRIKSLDTTTDLGRMIQRDMDILDKQFGFKSPVFEYEGGGTAANPNGDIYVDVAELKRRQAKSEVKYFELLLQFALTHEKAHEFQFRNYPRTFWDTRDAAKLRVLECQADLYAAVILGITFDADKYEAELSGNIQFFNPKTTNFENWSQKILRMIGERNPWKDIWHATLDMGDSRNIYSFHPTDAQRATGFQTGFWYGQIGQMALSLEEAKKRRIQIPQEAAKEIEEWVTEMFAQYGFSDEPLNETTDEFTLREAKLLTHYSDGALEKIALTVDDVTWVPLREDDRIGMANYALTYRNTASRNIRIDMAVQLVYTGEFAPLDPEVTDLALTKRYSFTLTPNQEKRIAGKFPFIKKYRQYWIPALLRPPGELSLITSEYTGK